MNIEKKKKNFDEFFMNFENVEKMIDSMLQDIVSSGKLDEISKKPLVFGFSVKMSPDGKAKIDGFGNVKTREHKMRLVSAREPLFDINETGEDITITAEIPGADRENLDIKGKEDEVILRVKSSKRPFYKEVKLPSPVDPNSAVASLKNGVIELRFKKRSASIAEKHIKEK